MFDWIKQRNVFLSFECNHDTESSLFVLQFKKGWLWMRCCAMFKQVMLFPSFCHLSFSSGKANGTVQVIKWRQEQWTFVDAINYVKSNEGNLSLWNAMSRVAQNISFQVIGISPFTAFATHSYMLSINEFTTFIDSLMIHSKLVKPHQSLTTSFRCTPETHEWRKVSSGFFYGLFGTRKKPSRRI